jgi:hypothetical protein
MRTFNQWLAEADTTAADINKAFGGLAGAAQQGANDKILEYARRIASGEDPAMVLQGFQQGGPLWNAVMAKVRELQGSQTLSISGLEKKLNLRPGSLALEKSKDGSKVFVRNKLSGQAVAVNPSVQEIETAARKLFGMV